MMKRLGAVLSALVVLSVGYAGIGEARQSGGEWREGVLTDYHLEPDCEHRECVPSNPGEECCLYWVPE
jgi:hypothetical protein